ncbi:hypothetical protein CDAR_226471 [Caerostris darwini]|uniref:Uncharacterized protein n=1 Tax=Caerostris darwini TaxID=1538125 RepID=A0AAV4X2G8_9ARAC|nr:hypothetical protein CDAR_226471 [Caerostris darwini]
MLHICTELFTTRVICSTACQSIYHPRLAQDTAPQINCHFVAMVTLPSGAPQRCEPAIWGAVYDANNMLHSVSLHLSSVPRTRHGPSNQLSFRCHGYTSFRSTSKMRTSDLGTGPYDGRKGSGNEAMRMSEMEKNKKHSHPFLRTIRNLMPPLICPAGAGTTMAQIPDIIR